MLFRFLSSLFRRSIRLPEHEASAKLIYHYLHDLNNKDRDRLEAEICERGLAFGDLRVESMFASRAIFRVYVNGSERFPVAAVRQVLTSILREHGHADVWIIDGYSEGDLEVVALDPAVCSLAEAQFVSGFKNNVPFQQKTFITIETHSPRFEVYGEQGLAVVLDLVRHFGFVTEPAHFANESDQPLDEIVEYVRSWRDRSTEKWYSEMKYDPAGEKHLVYLDACRQHSFMVDGKKFVVLGGSKCPGFKLNNLPVSGREIEEPTLGMIKARAEFRESDKRRYVCKTCREEAAFRIISTHFEMSGDLGGFSSGGVSYACREPDHIEKIKEEDGGLRQTVEPLHREVW